MNVITWENRRYGDWNQKAHTISLTFEVIVTFFSFSLSALVFCHSLGKPLRLDDGMCSLLILCHVHQTCVKLCRKKLFAENEYSASHISCITIITYSPYNIQMHSRQFMPNVNYYLLVKQDSFAFLSLVFPFVVIFFIAPEARDREREDTRTIMKIDIISNCFTNIFYLELVLTSIVSHAMSRNSGERYRSRKN